MGAECSSSRQLGLKRAYIHTFTVITHHILSETMICYTDVLNYDILEFLNVTSGFRKGNFRHSFWNLGFVEVRECFELRRTHVGRAGFTEL